MNTESWKLQRGLLLLWRWLLPGLFALACWLLLLCPHKVRAFVPLSQSQWLLGRLSVQNKAATLPSSRSAIYQLGYIAGKLNSQNADPSSLQTAATLVKLPEGAVTAELMANLGQAFNNMDHGGIGAWVFGLFNFVNYILWSLSIVVVLISATSVIRMLAKPPMSFVRVHAQSFCSALLCCAIALQPAFQALLFWVCFYIIAAAARYPSSYSHLMALVGCIVSIPAFIWTFMPNAGAAQTELQSVFCSIFLWLVLTPVGIVCDSFFIRSLSSAALFWALGPAGMSAFLAFLGYN